MNLDFSGKSVLVCGGSKGIGAATAALFRSSGARVTVVSRSRPSSDQLEHIGVDLSDRAQVNALSKRIERGEVKVDILVNNSGGPKSGASLNIDFEDFDPSLNNHLYANMKLSQAAVHQMRSRSCGRIINIISVSGKVPVRGLAISNAIRGAVINWAKTLSNDVAEMGITVNNVLPGYTETERLKEVFSGAAKLKGTDPSSVRESTIEQIPMKRLGRPEEVAFAVVFFASEQASFVTGTSLCVDGGWSPWA
jgi:3-oxoacyl-[acyl-carrier protein] reductase